jgi:iron complex transport system substrate-binding protein
VRSVRVVSLLPSATEILFAIGAGDDVVGVTFECDYPPQARTRRIVSTTTLPDGLSPAEIDRAVAQRLAAGEDLYRLDEGALRDLAADLVVTQDLCAVCAIDVDAVDDALDYLGCTAEVVTLDPTTLDDVWDTVTHLGQATGREKQAQALRGSIHARLDGLATSVRDAVPVPTAVLEWTDPPFAPGHWVPQMVALAGGHPVLGEAGARSVRISWDEVADSGAAVAVCAPCGYDLAGAASLAAAVVDAGRLPDGVPVWAIDANAAVARPGPRLVDGTLALAAILHPDRVAADPTLACRVA